jgi:poly(hydroxyalkanoate) depolymerase family esterase
MTYHPARLKEFVSTNHEKFAAALRYSWLRTGHGNSSSDALGQSPKLSMQTSAFGANPGDLRMLVHVPPHRIAKAPLVVVLHGCKQTAQAYAQGAGWLTLADQCGFAVLCPEQKSSNNRNCCFNWFYPSDTRRGEGEVESVRQMVSKAILDFDLDPELVFVTGLSAGGAMACALLAVYPEIFAGGAIIAGLPHGSATNVSEALGAMSEGQSRSASELGTVVRSASPHSGPWPKVSIWQGAADKTVNPSNAEQVTLQWTDVHNLSETPDRIDNIEGHARRVWLSPTGQILIESYTIEGLGHGTPLAAGGPDGCGAAGPFLIETGISSSSLIAASWGLERMREPHTETVDESLLMEPHANSEKLTLVTRSVGSMRAGSQIKLNSKIKAMIISMKRALGISSDS